MKKCYTCQEMLDTTEFNKNKGRKDGLNSICRKCSKLKSKEYYSENIEKHRKEVRKRSIKIVQWNKRFIQRLKARGCKLCNEKNWQCMDFHHLDPSLKEKEIHKLIHTGYSMDRIKAELRKCICVCSNCHRKIHAGIIKLGPQGIEP